MKALRYVLFGMVFFALLFFYLCNYFFNHYISYSIDKEATAKFEYKVGDIVSKVPSHYFRIFLGITTQGYYLTQEFYADGKPYSDPFLMETSFDLHGTITAYPLDRSGRRIGGFTAYYANGERMVAVYYTKQGNMDGKYVYWHENGQKNHEGYVVNNSQVGVWYSWDADGRLVKTTDYDKENREVEELLKQSKTLKN